MSDLVSVASLFLQLRHADLRLCEMLLLVSKLFRLFIIQDLSHISGDYESLRRARTEM